MYFSYRYVCDMCGDEKDLATNADNGGRCHECENGTYHKCGESYDQEWVEQQKYERRQDEEYEQRHRYNNRY